MNRHDTLLKHMACLEGGADQRMARASEEAAELIVAMSHYRRRRPGARAGLIDELADVMLTARGVMLAVGLEEEVLQRMQQKADALQGSFWYD